MEAVCLRYYPFVSVYGNVLHEGFSSTDRCISF
jgi:hypothetical protein